MRTFTLIASLATSLVLSNAALANDDGTSLGDGEAARTQLERDLSHFICGTPDGQKTEETDRVLDPEQIEIFADDLVAKLAAAETRGDELSTQAPDSNAADISDPEILVPISQVLTGDLTGDGFVNVDDILVVLSGWGGCSPLSINACIGDVNSDGYVNQHDLLLVFMNWH